jgi:hypothetical protein
MMLLTPEKLALLGLAGYVAQSFRAIANRSVVTYRKNPPESKEIMLDQTYL